MKKRRFKQLLASAIACSMVFSGVPATAYAAENGTVQEVVQEEDQSSTDSVSEDQSNAGQQENTENQDTDWTGTWPTIYGELGEKGRYNSVRQCKD